MRVHVSAGGRLTVLVRGYAGEPPDAVGDVVGEVIAEALHGHVVTGGASVVGVHRDVSVAAGLARDIDEPDLHAALADSHPWPTDPGPQMLPEDVADVDLDEILADAVVRLVDDDNMPLAQAAQVLGLSAPQARRWYQGDRP